jgi:hypothetical protein
MPVVSISAMLREKSSLTTTRGATSKSSANFSQQQCTSEPRIRLGRSADRPAASRFCSQVHFWAGSASMMVSEEPTVTVPAAGVSSELLPSVRGVCRVSAIMFTTRWWMAAVAGYSSKSMKSNRFANGCTGSLTVDRSPGERLSPAPSLSTGSPRKAPGESADH